MEKITGKKILKMLLLGTGIVVITPFLAGVIPDIIDLQIVTLGTAVSAGVAAFVMDMVLAQFMK